MKKNRPVKQNVELGKVNKRVSIITSSTFNFQFFVKKTGDTTLIDLTNFVPRAFILQLK